MKFSVIIPAYNCESTINATLDSVFRQTQSPFEILVMDDGSTDCTPALLREHASRVSIFTQPNAGLGGAKDALCRRVSGDIIAVIDSDDLWHPRYLEVQRQLIERYNPNAVAYFTGHVVFEASRDYQWAFDPLEGGAEARTIEPRRFIEEYNAAPGPFVPSSCCIPTHIVRELGPEAFKQRKAEDLYFFNRVGLLGPVVFSPQELMAYRVRADSLSANQLLLSEAEVGAFELLEERYGARIHGSSLSGGFRGGFAMKRRKYAKALMGAKRSSEARRQLLLSFGNSLEISSITKSSALLAATWLPRGLQPSWPKAGQDPRLKACA